MIDFTGRVVLVTGAAGGIGAATARTIAALRRRRRAARRSRGGRLAELAEELGERAHAVAADLADPAACRSCGREAVAWRGRVDVLINNAGIYEPASIETRSRHWTAAWERMLAICLIAPATLCREAIPTFRAQEGGGTIVNLASRAAFRGEDPDYWHYAAAKAGVVAMTKTIARQYGRDGVTAYAVAPGLRQHAVQRRARRAVRPRLLRRRHRPRRGRGPAGPRQRDRVPRLRPRPPRDRHDGRRQRRELCPLTLDVRLFVGGAWRRGGAGTLPIEDPATGRRPARWRSPARRTCEDAIDAAAAAFPAWAALPAAERGAVLKRAAALLDERARRRRRDARARGRQDDAEARGELRRAVETLAWNGEEAGRVEGRVIPGRGRRPAPLGARAARRRRRVHRVELPRRAGGAQARRGPRGRLHRGAEGRRGDAGHGGGGRRARSTTPARRPAPSTSCSATRPRSPSS